jgi:hypothetical protein
VPQVYVGPKGGSGWEAPRRLAGFSKVDLAPGASTKVSVTVDPRLLATFDSKAKTWTIAAGAYEVSLGASSRDLEAKADVFPQPGHRPGCFFDRMRLHRVKRAAITRPLPEATCSAVAQW